MSLGYVICKINERAGCRSQEKQRTKPAIREKGREYMSKKVWRPNKNKKSERWIHQREVLPQEASAGEKAEKAIRKTRTNVVY